MHSKMISEFVKEKRNAKKLSQKELAHKASVSFRSVQNIEANKSVKESTIQKVLKVLGFKMVIDVWFRPLK